MNNAKAAMLRELHEETGLSENDLESIRLKYVTLRYKNSEIRINYYFFGGLRENVVIRDYCDEDIFEWTNIDCVLKKEMPYSAKHVLDHYIKIGRYADSTYCGVAHKNGVSFMEWPNFQMFSEKKIKCEKALISRLRLFEFESCVKIVILSLRGKKSIRKF